MFLAAVAGARPLEDRERVAAERTPAPITKPRAAIRPFLVERRADRVEGRSHGVSRKQLAALRKGEIRPEATLDLHRLVAEDASRTLTRFIAESADAGHRCVLVIHGRGLHSAAGPVLGHRVIDVLSSSPTADHVRAFCSAAGRDGGVGAMYVWVSQP